MHMKLNGKQLLCKQRTSMFSKANGLMFKFNIDKAHIFYFDTPRRHELHMFFVFCPIDVIGIDKNGIILDYKKNFKPFRLFKFKKKVLNVIELPVGYFNFKLKDKVEFI